MKQPIENVYVPRPASLSIAPVGTPRPEYLKESWVSKLFGRERTMYILDKDFIVFINGVKYIVPLGYITDLASIPGLLRLWYPPSYSPAADAAVFHDRCYSHWYKDHLADGHWRYGVTKEFADAAFKAIMKYRGATEFEQDAYYWGVKHFGRGGWAK